MVHLGMQKANHRDSQAVSSKMFTVTSTFKLCKIKFVQAEKTEWLWASKIFICTDT